MFDFFNLMTNNLPLRQMIFFCIRIICASVCGAMVGFERSKRLKEAGIRTHIVVACTAAILMIISKYAFADLVDMSGNEFYGIRGADPARIAAQVVSGVSFLGAGVIFKNGSNVKGITTAAGIWATAAIGMAIGAGMYLIGFFFTILIVIVQFLTHKYTIGYDAYKIYSLSITAEEDLDFLSILDGKLDEWNAQIIDSKVTREEKNLLYSFMIRMPKDVEIGDNINLLRINKGVTKYEINSKS